MSDERICYRRLRHYKYQLRENFSIATDLRPQRPVDTDFISLTADGRLTIKALYAWDGPSGIALDTKTSMRGSLVHDALYQLMRERLLEFNYREAADDLLKTICIKDGMHPVRAWYMHKGVRWFGGKYAQPQAKLGPILSYAP